MSGGFRARGSVGLVARLKRPREPRAGRAAGRSPAQRRHRRVFLVSVAAVALFWLAAGLGPGSIAAAAEPCTRTAGQRRVCPVAVLRGSRPSNLAVRLSGSIRLARP